MDSEAEAKRKMQTLMRHNTEFMADCKRLREALERELKDKLAVREARDRFKSKWEATDVELKHEMAHSAKVLKKTEAECEAKVKQVQTKCAERLSQIKQMKQEHEHALAQKDLQIQQNKDALGFVEEVFGADGMHKFRAWQCKREIDAAKKERMSSSLQAPRAPVRAAQGQAGCLHVSVSSE